MTIKKQIFDFVKSQPGQTATRKQITDFYAAITGRNPATATLSLALSRPDNYVGFRGTRGYLRRDSRNDRRYLISLRRGEYTLID